MVDLFRCSCCTELVLHEQFDSYLWVLYFQFFSSSNIFSVLLKFESFAVYRNESGRFGALKSDSNHHFFRNACTKSGSLRFSQFSGCWLILSVYIIMSFYFPFVRLFGVRYFCYYPYLFCFIRSAAVIVIIISVTFFVWNIWNWCAHSNFVLHT
jgi:hypothetical protein